MKRRSKTKFTQIHVSIPVRTLEDFDDTLDFKQSRSKMIARLMHNYIEQGPDSISLMTTLEALELLQFRFKKDSAEDVLIQSLIRLLGE